MPKRDLNKAAKQHLRRAAFDGTSKKFEVAIFEEILVLSSLEYFFISVKDVCVFILNIYVEIALCDQVSLTDIDR